MNSDADDECQHFSLRLWKFVALTLTHTHRDPKQPEFIYLLVRFTEAD